MSDDIPPLIPETPPPMTKLDWEDDDDDDYMDYPHLAMDLPSESSSSPDGGWNPIDELPLPYDRDVDRPVGRIELNADDSLSNWTSDNVRNDRFLKSSLLSEKKSDLQPNNVSVWKENENIVPWVNIESLTSDNNCGSVNELDCKTEIKQNVSELPSENVIEANRKILINDEPSVTTEQQMCDLEHVQNTITPQCLPNLELQSNNSVIIENNDVIQSNVDPGSLPLGETLLNGYLKCIDINKLSNQSSCVQNVLLESSKIQVSSMDNCVNLSSNILENSINNPSNNNNNIINKNDKIDDYKKSINSCDLVDTTSSLDVPPPNMTSQEHDDINVGCQTIDQNNIPNQTLASKFNDENCKTLQTTALNETFEQHDDSFNVSSTFVQQQNNVIISEDTEFEDFCDFHSFSTSISENKTFCTNNDDEFYDFETSVPTSNDTIEFKHSCGHEKENTIITNEDKNLTLKSDNQINTNYNDDENFCDFDSDVHISHQVLDSKQNNVMMNIDSQDQLDYKQFCKDTFQGDYELCEEVNLQNLDDELNDSKVWKNLKDIESSPALNYNWTKSESNNVFLSSLSIDSRNILYGASWNPKVPRFAANMSKNPLEPLKASNNDTIGTKISQSFSSGPLQETVPDPEFDWKSSGLINPLDFRPQTWKTFEPVKNKSVKCEEIPVQSSPVNESGLDEFLNVSLPSSSNNQFIESQSSLVVPISIEAQKILDSLPNFEVLQKPYLVILQKENDRFFLH